MERRHFILMGLVGTFEFQDQMPLVSGKLPILSQPVLVLFSQV